VNSSLDLALNYFPLGVVCATLLVGIVLALVRWRLHPGVSLMALLGCAVPLAGLIIFAALDYWLWEQLRQGRRFEEVRDLSRVLSWVRVFFVAGGYALLFWAVFGWRERPRWGRPAGDERRFDVRYDDPRPRPRFGPPSGEGERGGPEDVRRPDY
jgi:hypothetical protein